MPRRSTHPRCRDCGRTPEDGARISRRNLCTECAVAREAAAIEQVALRKGEYHQKWIDGMMRAAMRAAGQHDVGPTGETGTITPGVDAVA